MKFIEMQPFARFVRQLKLDMETCFPTYVPLDARLFYVLSGEGQICIDNRAVSIPAGSVLFVSAGYAYRLLPCNAEYLAVNFDFTSEHADLDVPVPPANQGNLRQYSIIEKVNFEDALCFNEYAIFSNVFQLQRDLLRLEKEYVRKLPAYKTNCSHILASVLIELFRQAETRQSASRFDIKQIVRYVQKNYASLIDNRTVAEEFHFHPNYISSEFKRYTGKSLHQYVLETRILAALTLMEAGNQSIAEIAERTGFSDVNYFIRYFKKIMGTTPAKYIKNFR